MEGRITKKDLNNAFWRVNLFQISWNYERMQSLGYLYTMIPILKKVYAEKSKEEKTQAIQRHLEFFNTMPSFAAPIVGVTAALEEKEGNNAASVISAVKISLMGPLAGLGDSIVWLTWLPICMSIGASFCMEGNPLGLFIAFIMFNALNMSIKYFGIHLGYSQGVKFLDNVKESNLIQRYTTMATILGLILVGGLIPQMVVVNIPYSLVLGDLVVSIQELLDGIIPSLLPLCVTLLCCWIIKKGTKTTVVLFSIIVISIVCTFLGILG